MPAFQDHQHETRYKDHWFGKYRAFVRDNNDPERLGRLRLEIPAVLGSGKEHWSDWASPCFAFGGMADAGMFLVPEEGATVWAEFEGGQVQYPIWSGFWLARTNPGEQPLETTRLCEDPTCLDCEDKLDHAGDPLDQLEHGRFHGHPPYYCPRMRVVFKSETGHTLLADDRDQSECLKLIDRAGQMLHFEAPVKRQLQVGNSKRRGTHEAESGKVLDLKRDLAGGRAKVELTDAGRQFIRLEAHADHEKIHIQSGDVGRGRWQKILLDTTKGAEKLQLFGLNGGQHITLDGTKGRERVVLADKAGSRIIMDGVSGNIVLQAANMLIM